MGITGAVGCNRREARRRGREKPKLRRADKVRTQGAQARFDWLTDLFPPFLPPEKGGIWCVAGFVARNLTIFMILDPDMELV